MPQFDVDRKSDQTEPWRPNLTEIQPGVNGCCDAAGRTIPSLDALGEATLFTYDAAGNPLSVRDPNGVGQDCLYDPLGRDISCTDTAGADTSSSYTYDDVGNKLTEQYPDHTGGSPGDAGYGIVTFAYDPTGRFKTKQDQAGDTVTYNYDLAGRLTSRVYPSDTDSFTYDAAGRMLSTAGGRYGNTVAYDYDAAGRKASETQTVAGQDYVTQTSYDLTGQVSGYTYPDGTSVARTYSERGQLATIGYDGTVVDTRTYDDGGRILFRFSSYNNGVSQMRAHDNSACAASIAFSGAPIGSYSYSWDANKNKTAETITGAMSGIKEKSFTTGTSGYDDEDRLTGFTRGTLSQSWSLTSVGDWASFTSSGVGFQPAIGPRTHGPAHELTSVGTSPVTHDTKGNITSKPSSLNPTDTSSLAWDFDNRLDAIDVDGDTNVDVTFEYDALGRRVRKNDIVYALSGQQLIAEYAAGSAAASPTEKYVYASYIDEPVLKDGTGGLQYYHRNQQYSIIALTGSTGSISERYAYDAYGNLTVLDPSGSPFPLPNSNFNNGYTYTGRRFDAETGDYYYRARYYDSSLGRFCSKDPIGYVGSPKKNLYEYVSSMPLNSTDPTGLCAKCVVKTANAFNVTKDCGFLDGFDPKLGAWGFRFTSEFEFSNEDGASCDCCSFESWVLESSAKFWVEIGGQDRLLIDRVLINDDDGYQEIYGNREKPIIGDSYSECGYKMEDNPGTDIIPILNALAQQQPQLAQAMTTFKIQTTRTFFHRIVDSCNDDEQVWGYIFRKVCSKRYKIQGGKIVPAK